MESYFFSVGIKVIASSNIDASCHNRIKLHFSRKCSSALAESMSEYFKFNFAWKISDSEDVFLSASGSLNISKVKSFSLKNSKKKKKKIRVILLIYLVYFLKGLISLNCHTKLYSSCPKDQFLVLGFNHSFWT